MTKSIFLHKIEFYTKLDMCNTNLHIEMNDSEYGLYMLWMSLPKILVGVDTGLQAYLCELEITGIVTPAMRKDTFAVFLELLIQPNILPETRGELCKIMTDMSIFTPLSF